MKGILSILNFINDNWASIIAVVGLIFAIAGKTIQFLKLTKEQRKAFITGQVEDMVLYLVAEAEALYGSKTGEIKKSYVINKIFTAIPQLKDLISQEELTKVIDSAIEEALEKIKEIATRKDITPEALGATKTPTYVQHIYTTKNIGE